MLLHSVKMFAISRRLNHFVRLRSLAYAKYKMKTREELSAERREKHFNLIRSTITSALERRKSLSVTDWKSVVTELQKNSDIKNPIQLNTFILEALLSLRPPHDSLQNAKSCIEAFDIQHDLWTKRLLIQLYAKKASEVKLSSAEETEIIEMCNEFIAQEMHILPDMNSIVVAGICATKEWRRAFELEHLSSSSLNILMRKALRENEVEPTWVLFQTLLCSKKEFQFLSSKTINNFVKYFDRNPKDIPQNVDKLLTMCERIKKVFDAQSTEDLIRMLNKNGHHAEITTMNHSGKCGVCGNILEAAGITDKQFAILKDEFIKNVVNGKDIYLKTTPQEWKAFERTLQENGPFDIVMDGLNVAFLSNQLQNGVKFGNNKNRPCAHSLANAVAQLTNAGKRVLVVGRRHMARWPTIDYIKQMATLFLVDNISKDDIFLLYAAIHSGNNSYILSNDFMRQHKYAIGNKFDMLFKLWQQDHWYGFSSGNNQAIQLTKPMQFKMYTHKVGDFWHIPFKSREELESKTWNSYEMPKNWACIRIKQKM